MHCKVRSENYFLLLAMFTIVCAGANDGSGSDYERVVLWNRYYYHVCVCVCVSFLDADELR